MNKAVARFADGRVLKGTTADFLPGRDVFHMNLVPAPLAATPHAVNVDELKALFFVKDLDGDSHHTESDEFDPVRPPAGRRIRVVFADGEVLVGVTNGYRPERPGFFLEPADPDCNTERCYILTAATREVSFL